MKQLLFLFALMAVPFVKGQIDIELVEEPQEDPPAGIETPEAGDHSQTAPQGPENDLLHFLNEDRLSGELVRMDTENGLVWKHPDAREEVVFGTTNLKSIRLKVEDAEQSDLMSLPRIELTNGDQIRGRIIQMDNETLVIDSPLGGILNFRSDMVRTLRPEVVSSTLYSGPNSLEEWMQNNRGGQQWVFEDNALFSDAHNQILGMEIADFPDKSSLEFTLEWKGNVSMQVGFWGRDPKNVNQNCYTLAIQNGYLRCYRNYNKIGRNDLGNAQVRNLMNDQKIHIKLLLNREKKEVLVLFEGNLVARWIDTFDGKIVGDAIIFASMGNNPAKITEIEVRKWDGSFDMDAVEKPKKLDELVTVNGDIFVGQLQKIEADLLYFKNDFAEFQVPLERISEITMAKGTRSVPRLQAGDVEIFFANQERITLELQSLDETRFVGFSEATGDVELLKRYFAEIRMNPYDERHTVKEEGW